MRPIAKKRLEFAKQHLNKSQEYWNTVLFSDESKFNIFNSDGRRTVWRKKNTELNPKNLIPTVKHGGSVLVWGCMSATGVGKLHIINGIMDHKMYIEILKENLHVSTQKLEISDNYIFQHDNDPKHTAYNTKQWLLYNVPKQLHTPPQSPDLNPIEHLWGILKDAIKKRHISNREDLKIALQEEWESISPTIAPNQSTSYIMNATASVMPIVDVIEVREYGDSTTYYPMPYLTNDNYFYFKSAYDMDQYKVLKLISVIQRHIDQGVSTILHTSTKDSTRDLAKYYIYAHKLGLKSLYYTRTRKSTVDDCVSCSA